MNKLKLHSRRQVFKKFGHRLTIPYKGIIKERTLEFPVQRTLSRISKFNVNPPAPFDVFY